MLTMYFLPTVLSEYKPEMDNVPEGLNIVMYRGGEEPVFLPKTAVFSAKFSLEIIYNLRACYELSFIEY